MYVFKNPFRFVYFIFCAIDQTKIVYFRTFPVRLFIFELQILALRCVSGIGQFERSDLIELTVAAEYATIPGRSCPDVSVSRWRIDCTQSGHRSWSLPKPKQVKSKTRTACKLFYIIYSALYYNDLYLQIV